MGTQAATTMPKACTVAELNHWIDRFWDRQIFEPRGIVPSDDDRKVSRFVTSHALLLLSQDGVQPPITGSDLAKAIHRVFQDESTPDRLMQFMDKAQA